MLPDYSFTRYLAAKRSVDDRALNQGVWNSFLTTLSSIQQPHVPAQVLEIGAGIGTMVERLLEHQALTNCHYHAIDAETSNIAVAWERAQNWSSFVGYACQASQNLGSYFQAGLNHSASEGSANIQFAQQNLFDLLSAPEHQRRYNLVIAHAFMDLVNVKQVLPEMVKLLKPPGYLYLTLNFDGATIFQPTINLKLDALIESLYHATMDSRMIAGKPSGDSHTGRHLFHDLRQADLTVFAAGSSDWVVFPTPSGYLEDEAYFLHFIVNTVYSALHGHPLLPESQFKGWIQTRHQQIDRRELFYIAHQLDFFAGIGSSL
jgi:2-polyprenyl-3-methyl-5-hydroxy-6-metoxy-1,4-benzoquinol methylase